MKSLETNTNGITRRIMIDTNVWLSYLNEENTGYRYLIKKFIDNEINSRRVMTSKTIINEAKHVFRRKLCADGDKLGDEVEHYVSELRRIIKDVKIEKVKELDRTSPLCMKIKTMYETIFDGSNTKYACLKEEWIKKKFKKRLFKNNPNLMTPDEKQKFMSSIRLPPSNNDLNILAATAFVQSTTHLPVVLLTADSDFWIFGDPILKMFKVRVIPPWNDDLQKMIDDQNN